MVLNGERRLHIEKGGNRVNVINTDQKHTVKIKENIVGITWSLWLALSLQFLRSTLQNISFTIQLVFILFPVKIRSINYQHKNKDAVH